ncbi:hypothetical protein PFLA_a2910 [Pseudoalteromonas flavipulchra NCIMB 2033 = ATCC BAA-314]|nr:hypothetical protein [Pseudoalteromonas flavipulchra NCIMB 2033 = ATCC BAA-314]
MPYFFSIWLIQFVKGMPSVISALNQAQKSPPNGGLNSLKSL